MPDYSKRKKKKNIFHEEIKRMLWMNQKSTKSSIWKRKIQFSVQQKHQSIVYTKILGNDLA